MIAEENGISIDERQVIPTKGHTGIWHFLRD